MAKWEKLIEVRDAVNGALETARAEKKIGKSLEAHVTLVKDAASHDNLAPLQEKIADQWADLFIVSDVEVSDDALWAARAETPIAGVRVLVSEAKGEKVPRCWKHSTQPYNKKGLCPPPRRCGGQTHRRSINKNDRRGAQEDFCAPRSPKRKKDTAG